MFKGIERWVLYICFTIPVVIFSVLILIQRQYSLRFDRLLSAEGAHPEQMLEMNELFIKTFFLVFFCFLLILFGSMVTIRETVRVFRDVPERKLTESILSSTPGLVMLGLGCFFLFVSIFRPPALPFLPDLRLPEPVMAIKQDTIYREAEPDVAKDLQAGKKDKPANETFAPQPEREQQLAVTGTKKAGEENTFQADSDALHGQATADEKAWVAQLEANVIKYGYYPTKADNTRYNAIYGKLGPEAPALQTADHWAMRLMQQIQKGYQPTPEEMERYEKVIAGDLSKK